MANIGIEMEFTEMSLNNAQRLCPRGWKVDTDGSVRSQRAGNFLNPGGNSTDSNYGGEFISPIVVHDDPLFIRQITALTALLDQDDRASLHVHVSYEHMLEKTINALRLFLNFEEHFYIIGCMGNFHRGLENDYKYCRPIGNGVQYVNTNIGVTKCFDLDMILNNVKNFNDLWYALGRADQQENKWHPARYYGFNLLARKNLRTLEFRVFNSTTNYKYVIAAINLCVAFCEKAAAEKVVHKPTLLGSGTAKFSDLEYFDLSQETMQILRTIWIKSPRPLQPPVNQFNHLHRRVNWDRSPNLSHLTPAPIEEPIQIDGEENEDDHEEDQPQFPRPQAEQPSLNPLPTPRDISAMSRGTNTIRFDIDPDFNFTQTRRR